MIDLQKRYLKQNAFLPKSEDFKSLIADDNWGIYSNANMSIHVTVEQPLAKARGFLFHWK